MKDKSTTEINISPLTVPGSRDTQVSGDSRATLAAECAAKVYRNLIIIAILIL